MNILVVGGSGFIGTHLVRELQTLNHEVKIFDKKLSEAFNGIVTIGDVRNPSDLTNVVQGVDAIYHLVQNIGMMSVRYRSTTK